MSCLIILDDGRACAPSAWTFTAMMSAIADQFEPTEEAQQLADWLQRQASEMQRAGRGRLDLRELTPENRGMFRDAVMRLAVRYNYHGAADGAGVAFPGWVRRLRRLVKMMQSIERGESPDAISDVSAPVAPTGLRRGPGWRVAV